MGNDKVEWLEKQKRKNNVVIQGKKLDTNDTEILKEGMKAMIEQELEITVQVKSAYKLGEKTCLIELEREEDKVNIMKNKYKLKNNKEERIFINQDETKKEREKAKKLKKENTGQKLKVTDLANEKDKNRKVNQKKEIIWKIGTWNVRSIQGKEKELEEEFDDLGLDLLAVTETKKKGKGLLKTDAEHLFIYSGVQERNRASAGVGCIIHRKLSQQVHEWKGWSERILSIEIKDNEEHIKTIIIVYGPNEDDKAQTKDTFWEDLTIITEEAKGKSGDLAGQASAQDRLDQSIFVQHLTQHLGNQMQHCRQERHLVKTTFGDSG
ncbi:unnamed protein product [Phaedon cochleariae]|uniref:Uncharacterized protein n=1 Tax=Phaedon cochleariae TaxID=80249 RepID=A0A9P0DTQ3_PHACE|nr:unnamed protein product [Phaedon cochleariae]